VLTVEGVPGEMTGLDAAGYRMVEGCLEVPSTPGFGLPLPARRAEGRCQPPASLGAGE
jgi:hypothetical protein